MASTDPGGGFILAPAISGVAPNQTPNPVAESESIPSIEPIPLAVTPSPTTPTLSQEEDHLAEAEAKADHVEAFLDGWYGVRRTGPRKWTSLDALKVQASQFGPSSSTSTTSSPSSPAPSRPPRRRRSLNTMAPATTLSLSPSPSPSTSTSARPFPFPPKTVPADPFTFSYPVQRIIDYTPTPISPHHVMPAMEPSTTTQEDLSRGNSINSITSSIPSRTTSRQRSHDTFGRTPARSSSHVSFASSSSETSDQTLPARRQRARFAQEVTFEPIHSVVAASPVQAKEEEDLDDDDGGEVANGFPKSAFVDAALRMQPGVRGLGEGWAGGPQRKKKESRGSWLTRKTTKTAKEVDPLALWDIDESKERAGEDAKKGLWNRSKLRLFGSMTALPSSGLAAPSMEKDNSDGWRRKRQSLTNLLSRSTTALPSYRRNAQSTSNLPSHTASASFAPVAIPSRNASLAAPQPKPAFVSGPVPPLRRKSLVLAGRPQTPFIPEVEEQPTTSSSPNLARPVSPELPEPITQNELMRTSTFGADDVARGSDLQHATPITTESPVGLDSLAGWAEEDEKRSTTPMMIRDGNGSGKRDSSIMGRFKRFRHASFDRMMTAQRTQHTRSISDPILLTQTRNAAADVPLQEQGQGDPESFAYAVTRQAVEEALETPPRPPSSASTTRRKSWVNMIPNSDSFISRLSKLTEHTEASSDVRDEPDGEMRPSSPRIKRLSSFLPVTRMARPPPSSREATFYSRAPSRFAMTDLDLPLRLSGEGLGLEDIIDETRRTAILSTMEGTDFPLPPPRTPELSLHASTPPSFSTGETDHLVTPVTPRKQQERIDFLPVMHFPGGPSLMHASTSRESLSVDGGEDNERFMTAPTTPLLEFSEHKVGLGMSLGGGKARAPDLGMASDGKAMLLGRNSFSNAAKTQDRRVSEGESFRSSFSAEGSRYEDALVGEAVRVSVNGGQEGEVRRAEMVSLESARGGAA